MNRPLTRAQHRRAIFLGRISLWLVGRIPIWWAPAWLITSAGFYAYDTGWRDYRWRCEEKAKEIQ